MKEPPYFPYMGDRKLNDQFQYEGETYTILEISDLGNGWRKYRLSRSGGHGKGKGNFCVIKQKSKKINRIFINKTPQGIRIKYDFHAKWIKRTHKIDIEKFTEAMSDQECGVYEAILDGVNNDGFPLMKFLRRIDLQGQEDGDSIPAKETITRQPRKAEPKYVSEISIQISMMFGRDWKSLVNGKLTFTEFLRSFYQRVWDKIEKEEWHQRDAYNLAIQYLESELRRFCWSYYNDTFKHKEAEP